uniref:Ubiquitin carboxyl-terminal hydrolase n=1 Tax=Plectus sambesii TaxID=2011161 RepID=A0A914WPL0_9BILA
MDARTSIPSLFSLRSGSTAIPLPPPPPPLMSSVASSSGGPKGSLFGGPSSASSSAFSTSTYMRDPSAATPGTYPRGQCGLQNLGNTCFMNSALQCLSNVVDLTQYFLSGRYEDDINEDNPLGMHGQLARSYGELIQQMWSGSHRSVLPRKLKTIIGQFAPRFSGYQQQDSQELLAFLLDGLHEDLNKVKKKPYVEEKEADGRPDKEVALESWSDYRTRNDSVIVDLFHGQLKSTLVCPQCAKVSIKFDPFCFLSLPLPQRDKEMSVDVTFVPRNSEKKWTKYKVCVPKKGPVNNVLTGFAMIANVDVENLVIVEMDCIGRISKFPRGGDMCRNPAMNSDEYFVYELDKVPKEDEPVTVVATQYFRTEDDDHKRVVGRPIIFRTKKEALTRARVSEELWKRVRDVFTSDSGDSEKDGEWMRKDDEEDEQDDDSGVEENDRQDDVMMAADDNDNGNMDSEREQTSSDEPPSRFHLAVSNSREGPWEKFPLDDQPFEPKPQSFYGASPTIEGPVVYVSLYWHPMAAKNLWCKEWETNVELDSSMNSMANPSPKRQVTIDDCFDLFTKEEQLGEEDSWYCPKCKDFRRATKKLDLWQLPEVLIIHLKRFQYSRWYRDKIETVVDFPVRGLDLREKVLNEAHAADLYDLTAISHHMGGLGGGHYTASALNNGRWVDFNDSQTSTIDVSGDTLASREAYVLLYRRRSNKQVIVRGIEPNIEMECDEEEE